MYISVVIPLYNKKEFIYRCLTSVLTQTYSNFEIIIVNDGSTDNSLEFIKSKFDSSKFNVFSQKNAGVSAARNKGVSLANYKWIAFLDADDYWHENFLQEIVKTIKKFPNASLCSTGYQFLSANHFKRAKLCVSGAGDYRVIDNYFLSSCKGDLPITASSVAINKEHFKAVERFPEGWAMGEDIYLWMKMAINFQLVICMKTLVTYDHSDENSATKKNQVLDILPHVNALEYWIHNNKIPEPLNKSAAILLHRSYIYTAFQNIKYGNKKKAANLMTSPNVFNGWHKLVIRILPICPDWITKRLN